MFFSLSFRFCFSEIAELMAVRTKFGPTGEFQPEWRPPVRLSLHFALVQVADVS